MSTENGDTPPLTLGKMLDYCAARGEEGDMGGGVRVVVTVLLALCVMAGCATRLGQVPVDPEMEWDHYVDYLVRMQTASTWDGSEFIKAISYFERMTGIDSGLNKGYFGIVRDNDTLRNALQQWSTWRRSHSCASPPLRVELRSVGDDGLSVRFRDALEAAVRDDHRFTLALADESSADIVAFIPTNLTWKQIGARVKASYSLQLDSPSGAKLGISTGSCWEDDLRSCVGRAMRDLRRATRQMK